MLADISVDIRVDDVFRRHLPPLHRVFELLPVCGAVESQRAEIACCAGLRAHPAQHQRALRVFPENWSMPGKFQLHGYRGASAYANRLFLDPEILPAFRAAVLLRVGW